MRFKLLAYGCLCAASMLILAQRNEEPGTTHSRDKWVWATLGVGIHAQVLSLTLSTIFGSQP